LLVKYRHVFIPTRKEGPTRYEKLSQNENGYVVIFLKKLGYLSKWLSTLAQERRHPLVKC